MNNKKRYMNEQCTMNNVQWKKVKLGDCCERICNGLTYDVEETHGYIVTRIETISDGYIDYHKIGHIKGKPNQDYLMIKGDILFSHINSVKHIGKVAYYDDSVELYHGMNLLLLRANSNIDKLFLFYLLSSENYRRKIRTLAKSAVNQASISTTDLGRFNISYPESLAAQRRIAAILSSADKVIDSTQRLIEKYKKMKQGMMEELLNEQYTMNNVQWKKVRLGEVCERITDGSHDSPKATDTGYYMPSVKDMTYNSFDFTNCKKISESDYFRLKNMGCKPEVGDVLIAKDGSILKYCFVMKKDLPIVILSSIAILKPNKSIIDSQYLAYYFQKQDVVTDVIENYKSGTGVPRIVLRNFAEIEISFPKSIAEQVHISEILSGIDKKIAAEEKVLEKYKEVKKGLMERLMEIE